MLENYLAAACLLNWFYSSIDLVAVDPTLIPLNWPPNMWTVVHNHGWLAARKLEIKGNTQHLRDTVKIHMEQEGGLPPITGPKGGPVSNVHAVVASLKAMVSYLMCSSVTKAWIRDVEHHIKIFLNCFEEFDDAMSESKDKPTWVSSYNFLCLTNLPALLWEFGPLRNLGAG